jgi:hypothetical protein
LLNQAITNGLQISLKDKSVKSSFISKEDDGEDEN